MPPFLIKEKLTPRPTVLKNADIKYCISLVSIEIVHIFNFDNIKTNMEKNNPPITGAGIQNLIKNLTLFFIRFPIKKVLLLKLRLK